MKYLFQPILKQSSNKRLYSQRRDDNDYKGVFIMSLFITVPLALATIGAKISYDNKQRENEYKRSLEEQMELIKQFEALRLERHMKWHDVDPEHYSKEKFLEEQREGQRIMQSWKK